MTKKIYGIALIGCGCMGKAHLDEIYSKENVAIKCVCDLDENRAKKFARLYNAERITKDYREAIVADDVDIVIISTYPSTHLEMLSICIEYGKHVLCEKPIAGNLEEGEKLVKLVKDNPQCKVLIGYILRHNKTYQRVAQMIKSGAIGSPIIMRMAQNHHTMDWQKYLSLIKETSPIVDCGVHYIDVMQWFTGATVTNVNAIGIRTEEDVPEECYNYGLLTARLSDGSIGYYEAGWSNTMSSDNLKEFVGPKGRIRITYENLRHENQEEGDLIEYYQYPERSYTIINVKCKRKPTDDQLDALIDMIENDSPGTPTIDEVYSSFKTVCEADEIIKKGMK